MECTGIDLVEEGVASLSLGATKPGLIFLVKYTLPQMVSESDVVHFVGILVRRRDSSSHYGPQMSKRTVLGKSKHAHGG